MTIKDGYAHHVITPLPKINYQLRMTLETNVDTVETG